MSTNNSTKDTPRPRRSDGRERLISTARELFWQKGYESTSPNDIYRFSGVGQGSFYHHFSGKLDLLHTVLEMVANEEIQALDKIEATIDSPYERIVCYLSQKRDALKGCKFGRFVYESSMENRELYEPIRAYFKRLEKFLINNIKQAQSSQEMTKELNARKLAILMLTSIQGGYILSRAHHDPKFLLASLSSMRELATKMKLR